MFLSYIFLLQNFHENKFIPHSSDNSSVIIPVTSYLWEHKRECLETLNGAQNSFCFAISAPGLSIRQQAMAETWNALSTFFFLPNYIKKAAAYLVLVDESLPGQKVLVKQTEKALLRQGIAPLSKNYLDSTPGAANNVSEHCYFNAQIASGTNPSPEDFSQLFQSMVREEALNKQIIVVVESAEDFERKSGYISKFEQWVEQNQKPYLELFLSYKSATDNLQNLDTENRKLKFRIDNYNDYLNLLRETATWHVEEYHRIHKEKDMFAQRLNALTYGRTEAYTSPQGNTGAELQTELEYLKTSRENILSWYSKEYELLPLWYKRFGHVIKVMMGKRSFKSLYK